jgi:CDP-6-deoxy-D-xylo-4-hexulose-3-dehydrase
VYEKSKPVWFALPLTITEDAPFTRKELVEWLETKRIETRPFFAGLISKQPGYENVDLEIRGDLPVTKYTKDNSFFIGCYQGISEEMVEYVIESFREFFKKY